MATLIITGNDLYRDAGLETAVLISLFTDQRADPNTDTLPDNTQDLRGYWGDAFTEKPLGSKIWLELRSKATPDVSKKISQRCEEALQWMLDDGVVKEVKASAEIQEPDTLLLAIDITEPNGQQRFYKYALNWEAEEIKRRT